VSAVYVRNGIEIPVTAAGLQAPIPYKITAVGGDFDVHWTYTVEGHEFNRIDNHRVVTPMFTKPALLAWDQDFALLSDSKIVSLERIIRNVIESVTGQTFNYEYASITVPGSGGSVVSLPKRLVTAESLNDRTGELLDSTVYRKNDGWTLSVFSEPSWVERKFTAPITAPWERYGSFRADTQYTISGYWGYASIPSDIAMAALLLAEDYGCDESLWRDRYVANMRSADWRFEFDARAYEGTGNVKVDRLLQKYTLNRMVVM
jgi:hypothetical protein